MDVVTPLVNPRYTGVVDVFVIITLFLVARAPTMSVAPVPTDTCPVAPWSGAVLSSWFVTLTFNDPTAGEPVVVKVIWDNAEFDTATVPETVACTAKVPALVTTPEKVVGGLATMAAAIADAVGGVKVVTVAVGKLTGIGFAALTGVAPTKLLAFTARASDPAGEPPTGGATPKTDESALAPRLTGWTDCQNVPVTATEPLTATVGGFATMAAAMDAAVGGVRAVIVAVGKATGTDDPATCVPKPISVPLK